MSVWRVAQKKEQKFQQSHLKPAKIDIEAFYKLFSLSQDFFKSSKVLEVGANMNSPIYHLVDADVTVGCDPLSSFYASALPDGAQQIQGRGEELPFNSETFDAVICLNVLDHVEKPVVVLQQIGNSLKPNGIFLMSIHVFPWPSLIRRCILNKIDSVHPHHFSLNELMGLLRSAGFKVSVVPKKSSNIIKYVFKSAHKEIQSKNYLSAIRLTFAVCIFRLKGICLKCKKSC